MRSSQASLNAIALVSVAALLTACAETGVEGRGGSGVEVMANANTATGSTLIDRDVEAPDVFSVSDDGLWDGRPSLGGVWVAYSEVKDPERVIIRNEANGKTVIGALFRRERDNPGPRIQVSSDAAAALGMLAGSPASLNVTALKRAEPPPPPAAEAPTPAEEAAIAAAEKKNAAKPAAEASVAAAATEATAEGAEPASAEIAAEEPPKKGFLGLFAKRKPKVETEAMPTEGSDIAAATASAIETTPITATSLDAAPASAAAPSAAPVAAAAVIADDAAPEATGDITPAPKRKGLFGFMKSKQVGEPLNGLAPIDASAPAAEPAAPAKAAKSSGKNFVQIGIFSEPANAEKAAAMLRKDGLVPTVRESSASGKSYWRVVVGPATKAADRDAVLTKVKDLGFKDAYFVTG